MKKRQLGVGMIEILVALLVTSVGLIGVTGMQAMSLKNNVTSMNQANVIFLAGTIMDRIRITDTNSNYATAYDDSPSVDASTSCQSTVCTQDELVKYYVSQWKCLLGGYSSDNNCADVDAVLPDGEGSISYDNGSGVYTISIRYTDTINFENGERDSDGQQVVFQTEIIP